MQSFFNKIVVNMNAQKRNQANRKPKNEIKFDIK